MRGSLTREDVARIMGVDSFPEGWKFVEVKRGNELAGIFFTQGPEIHCFRIESFNGRWLTRQDIERLTKPLFSEYGFISTKVKKENDTGHRFITRLGFTITGESDGCIFYRAERLNHARL